MERDNRPAIEIIGHFGFVGKKFPPQFVIEEASWDSSVRVGSSIRGFASNLAAIHLR
jgi:hypothetical protein